MMCFEFEVGLTRFGHDSSAVVVAVSTFKTAHLAFGLFSFAEPSARSVNGSRWTVSLEGNRLLRVVVVVSYQSSRTLGP